MSWIPASPPTECRTCRAPLPPSQGRGRTPEYCSPACRQAAYRRRREHARSALERYPTPRGTQAPDPSPEEQVLLDLARAARTELDHVIRLLTPQQETATHGTIVRAPITHAAQVLEQLDALLAGIVLRARHHDTSWETIGALLNASPQTARRTYHVQSVRRRFDNLGLLSTDEEITDDAPAESATLTPVDESPPEQEPPVAHRARSQLAPILSRLQRAAHLPLRQLGHRTRVSASYLSRVLTGERFPSWDLTERLGHALGADVCTLRQIWDDEHRRLTTEKLRAAAQAAHTSGSPASHTDLPTALRALARRCGSPTPREVAVVAHNALPPEHITAALAGSYLPDWPRTERLVRALQGDPVAFQPLWQHAATDAGALLASPPAASGLPDRSANARGRLESLFAAFGPTLSTPPPAFARR
ncbi:helix-turn-helix transcriptional regulator [Streptomyces diacarni]|uniref:helix-turn-helix domain-containing protein n=1 Tax=Streptomyces diacarni TaxID=2800381 RepID=UPI0033C98C87